MTTALLSPGRAQAAVKTVNGKKILVKSNPSKKCLTNREIVTPRRADSCAAERWTQPHPEWRFTMGTFSGPHVPRVSLGISALKPGLEALARSWRWLSTSLSDPYRPELHYMRGPGPKYREKLSRVRRSRLAHNTMTWRNGVNSHG